MADTTVAECYFCKVEGDCISDENGKWKCAECASTLPKAEGVGENWKDKLHIEADKMYQLEWHKFGGQPCFDFVEQWFVKYFQEKVLPNLLTSATRAAEERKDGEFRELAEKSIIDALKNSHGDYCPAKTNEDTECQCAMYGRLQRMVEMLYASLLPPPPDKPTQL